VLRGAFIGFGNVAAQAHLPSWRASDNVTIVGATDALAARRDAFLACCPNGRWYADVEELLSSETLDFVDICTPPSSHAALISQVLGADLHVLCEKPLVTRTDDARLIAAAARRTTRVVHTVHNWLKAPVCRRISELIDAGAIGDTRSVRWRTVRTRPAVALGEDGSANWRLDPVIAGGGILLDHGWHALYCIARWAGAPRGIAAVLENRRFRVSPIEDTATLTLDLMAGTGDIFLTWAGEERSNCIEIEGERGHIHVAKDRLVLKTRSDERHWRCSPALSESSHHADWFSGVADDFRFAITGGSEGNLEDALLCAQLIDLAQRSNLAGGAPLSVSSP
jgi:predicted dehydrogenase